MAMRPTRKIIAEFVGVFLIGAGAGGLITWSYYTDAENSNLQFPVLRFPDTTLSTFMSRTNDDPDSIGARMNKKYADEYHLTPDELSRIQPTIKEMAQQIYQVRHQFGVDVMAMLDKYHQEIAEQLTPEHRAAYEAAMAERRKKLAKVLLPDQSSPSQGAK
jgi:uncharacterized membrane protein